MNNARVSQTYRTAQGRLTIGFEGDALTPDVLALIQALCALVEQNLKPSEAAS